MRGFALLIGTNLAVLVVLGIVMTLLEPWLVSQGISVNLAWTLGFALIFGMGGAFLSLMLSKSMALRSTRARVINQANGQTERWLVETVARQAKAAGIGMPDVAIYDAPEPNAFATGASRNNALVAVSTGLLRNMRPNEVEAVLGHEVAHVANGDMVTLTLIQGVLNTFVLFLSRILGQLIDRVVFRSDRAYGPGYFISVIVLQMVLGILASMIVMAFSRWREFRADAGGAQLAGRANMIAALRRLQAGSAASSLPESVEAFGISGRVGDGLKRLMMSHPPLEERIRVLSQGA
ncbi:MAG: protease HtpX [Wenzhouxiangella sp.]|nr:protease HtpX [Wenzhouxiangella sp.]MCH8478377.1 protease HtpX [Wenzhouxiangella sp.]TVR97307.1 MAG: protease HtpX [Wenzhouxiangellaceae bacterium]